MTAESEKSAIRSVDSVANIYAIVIGLALTQAIEALVGKVGDGGANLDAIRILQGTPAFVALLVTLLPFWHGMNRHLDRCYISKAGSVAHYAILLDFVTFFLEAILMFVAGWSLRQGLLTFYCLGLLLLVDMVWGFISHLIHFPHEKSHVIIWSGINIVAGVIGFCVCAFPFQSKAWVLMVLAIGRTVADYLLGGDFYFPRVRQQA